MPLRLAKSIYRYSWVQEYGEEKNYSEETSRQIDSEVKAVIQESYQRVKRLLQENRAVLDSLASELEEREVLSGEEIEAIIKKS